MAYYIVFNELYHHGILGQKWGVRRYQNPDGTLTEAGKKRYQKEIANQWKKEKDVKNKLTKEDISKMRENRQIVAGKARSEWFNSKEFNKPIDYWGKLYKQFGDDIPEDRVNKYYDLLEKSEKKRREIWESYYDKYAEALLKDLDLPSSKDAIEYVKSLDYLYDM